MKTITTHILAVCMVLCGLSALTSCTDYQDEIDALNFRVTVLEQLSKTVNNNLTALQGLVDSMEHGDYITNVTEIEGGYIVTFHEAGAITILNGRDGRDGRDGQDGYNGRDAQAPDISIALADDGNYYWTLNGEWLLVDGQKVRANGRDGRDGQDGQSTAPQVRINPATGEWEISVDGGVTWTGTGTIATGKGNNGRDGQDGQDGKDGDSMFESVYITVSEDGTRIVVFRLKGGVSFTVPIA